MSNHNVNCMDIRIVDLQGNEYDINDIKVYGNDFISIRIKKPTENSDNLLKKLLKKQECF